LQCGHRCFRQRWHARIFIFILRRSDRAHHPAPSAAVAARNSSTVSVQAAPTRADRIGKTPPACARCRDRSLADRPRCDRALKFLDSRASPSRAFLCGRRGKAGAFKSARCRARRLGDQILPQTSGRHPPADVISWSHVPQTMVLSSLSPNYGQGWSDIADARRCPNLHARQPSRRRPSAAVMAEGMRDTARCR